MGEQKYFKDGAILVRYAASVNAEHTQWSDDIIAISQEDYEAAYGQDPRNLTNYVVSQDTVQNAVMEETGDGTYAITFDLEPEGASVYYKRAGAHLRRRVQESDLPLGPYGLDDRQRVAHPADGHRRKLRHRHAGHRQPELHRHADGGLFRLRRGHGRSGRVPEVSGDEYDPNNLGKLNEAEDTQKIIQDFFVRTPDYRVTVSANGKSYTLDVHVDLAQTPSRRAARLRA